MFSVTIQRMRQLFVNLFRRELGLANPGQGPVGQYKLKKHISSFSPVGVGGLDLRAAAGGLIAVPRRQVGTRTRRDDHRRFDPFPRPGKPVISLPGFEIGTSHRLAVHRADHILGGGRKDRPYGAQ